MRRFLPTRRLRSAALACLLALTAIAAAAQMNVGPGHGYKLYRETLLMWSEDRDVEALRKLIELRESLGGLPGMFLDVDLELSAGRPRVLVPTLGLFEALHAWDLQRARSGDAGAPTDARDLRIRMERIAGHLMKRSPRAATGSRALSATEARAIVSRMWSSVGAALRDGTYLEEALSWFQEALELDPRNVGAAVSAGAVEEKMGRYAAAQKLFEQVLDVAPDHPEARLRRALSILRDGGAKRAEELFATLGESDAPTWIRVLAFEERAQSLFERGQREHALEVTLAGREVAPEDEGLLLLQVWLRGDRTETSRALLGQLGGEPTGEPDLSPRALYNLWPPDLEATVERWRQDVDEHRPLLRKALLSENL